MDFKIIVAAVQMRGKYGAPVGRHDDRYYEDRYDGYGGSRRSLFD